MKARSRFKVPGDGRWHSIPFAPVEMIEAPLHVMTDIDDYGRGKVRAPADGRVHEVTFLFGKNPEEKR